MRKTKGLLTTVMGAVFLLSGCSFAGEKSEPVSSQEPLNQASVKNESESLEVYEGTISGVISDSMCGADHSMHGELGKNPIACTKECVKNGAKLVLVTDEKVVYSLSDADKANDYAGKPVEISGHIDPKSKAIHIHEIKGN